MRKRIKIRCSSVPEIVYGLELFRNNTTKMVILYVPKIKHLNLYHYQNKQITPELCCKQLTDLLVEG